MIKQNTYLNTYNTIDDILNTPNHLQPNTQHVRRYFKIERLQPTPKKPMHRTNKQLTTLLTGEPGKTQPYNNPHLEKAEGEIKPCKELTTNSNYLDAFNHIPDTYQKGLYILSVEYTYLAIKKMVKNGVKSNDDAYIQLFDLQKSFWSNGYNSNNYINDLIQLVYIDLLETFPNSSKSMYYITTIAKRLEKCNLASNYDLHMAFNQCYYKKGNPLIEYQNTVVNRIRTYYRNKGDMVERCQESTVNTYAVNYASDQLKKQRQLELISKKDLITEINAIVNQCTKSQKLVFELRIAESLSFKDIAHKTGSTVQSCINMYNKVVGRIRTGINLDNYILDSNCNDVYIVGQQLEEMVPGK